MLGTTACTVNLKPYVHLRIARRSTIAKERRTIGLLVGTCNGNCFDVNNVYPTSDLTTQYTKSDKLEEKNDFVENWKQEVAMIANQVKIENDYFPAEVPRQSIIGIYTSDTTAADADLFKLLNGIISQKFNSDFPKMQKYLRIDSMMNDKLIEAAKKSENEKQNKEDISPESIGIVGINMCIVDTEGKTIQNGVPYQYVANSAEKIILQKLLQFNVIGSRPDLQNIIGMANTSLEDIRSKIIYEGKACVVPQAHAIKVSKLLAALYELPIEKEDLVALSQNCNAAKSKFSKSKKNY